MSSTYPDNPGRNIFHSKLLPVLKYRILKSIPVKRTRNFLIKHPLARKDSEPFRIFFCAAGPSFVPSFYKMILSEKKDTRMLRAFFFSSLGKDLVHINAIIFYLFVGERRQRRTKINSVGNCFK